MSRTRTLRAGLLLTGSLLCGGIGFQELQYLRADFLAQSGTEDGLREALLLAPGDAGKWSQLGAAMLERADLGAAVPLRQAVELNPFDTRALTGLARLEGPEGADRAEQYLIQASQRSRLLSQLHALADFYLRRGLGRWPYPAPEPAKLEQFWNVAAQAVNLRAADASPVLRLAHQAGAEPDEILARLALDSDHSRTGYLRFALSEGYLESLARVALQLRTVRTHEALLFTVCERLIDAGRADDAVPVWNKLLAASEWGFAGLDTGRGQSLSNPDFLAEPGRGFSWRMLPAEGIRVTPSPKSGIHIRLSGQQGESGAVLLQYMPVLPARKYRLSFDHQVSSPPAPTPAESPTGLSWFVQAPMAGGDLVLGSEPVSQAPGGRTSLEFLTPAECKLIRVVLLYRRAPGTARAPAGLDLERAQLELLP